MKIGGILAAGWREGIEFRHPMKSPSSAQGLSFSPSPLSPGERRLLPPEWVAGLLGPEARRGAGDESTLDLGQGGDFSPATVRARGAPALARPAFQDATAGAYRRLEAVLCPLRARHPVR